MSKEKKQSQEYLSDSVEVVAGTPLDLDVEKELGAITNIGWITSDDGVVLVQLNGNATQKIPLTAGDTLNFTEEEKWSIQRVIVTTTSILNLTVRYFFRKKEVVE